MEPKIEMDVPLQVREFARKSVDQVERAISSFMESASKSIAMVPTPMNDVAKQALAIAEANMKASFDHARKLMEARDIAEVMKILKRSPKLGQSELEFSGVMKRSEP